MHRASMRKFLTILFVLTSLICYTSQVSAQSTTAILGIFEDYSVAPGGMIQVPISIKDVSDLYAVDITMQFDPKLLQIQDADPSIPGIQAALGSFLDPGLVLFNTIDNEKGILRFTMTQYNPSEAKSGDGILLLVTFQGLMQGTSPLSFSDVQLATRDGLAIPVQTQNSNIIVVSNAPTQAATIPVTVAPGLIMVYTPTPTQAPVLFERIVRTPTPTEVKSEQPASTQPTQTTMDAESSSYFLVENWWIVLTLLVIVVAVGIYFSMAKRKSK